MIAASNKVLWGPYTPCMFHLGLSGGADGFGGPRGFPEFLWDPRGKKKNQKHESAILNIILGAMPLLAQKSGYILH